MILDAIALAVGGFISAAPDLIRHNSGLKRLAWKLEPWQGTVGSTLFVLGIIALIRIILTLTQTSAAVFLVLLATAAIQIALGLLLGVPFILKLPVPALQKQSTKDKLRRWRSVLQPYNTRLGFGAMVVGVLLLFL